MKPKFKSEQDWDGIVRDFSNFKGTIAEFCKIKGVSKSQLYYQRKARNMINNNENTEAGISFTKISLKQDDEIILEQNNIEQNNQVPQNCDLEKTLLSEDNSINVQIGGGENIAVLYCNLNSLNWELLNNVIVSLLSLGYCEL